MKYVEQNMLRMATHRKIQFIAERVFQSKVEAHMKRVNVLVLISALIFFAGLNSYAGGDSHIPVAFPCNSGIDGNRDCVGDQNSNSNIQPTRKPLTKSCPEMVELDLKLSIFTVHAIGLAVSATDSGFGPTSCEYRIASFVSSERDAHVVNLGILDDNNFWLDFVANGHNFRVRQAKLNADAEGALIELKSFANPGEVLSAQALPMQSTEINISSLLVRVPTVAN